MRTTSRLAIPSLLGSLVLAAFLVQPAGGQAKPLPAPWDSVARILQTSGTLTGGYYRYGLPRADLALHIGDVTVATPLGLGAWAGFGGSGNAATMMGDLIVTADELAPVLAALAEQKIGVTAIHNHLVGEDPQVTYVHIHGEGRALDLAARLAQVVTHTKTPLPVKAAAAQPLTIDSAEVFRTLGTSGRAAGAVAQVTLVLVPGRVTMHGKRVIPALGYGTPINVQAVSATREVASGDYAIVAARVAPVLTALTSHHITATALHSHLVGETPKLYYIHFWADGAPAEVLGGLRAAIDAAH